MGAEIPARAEHLACINHATCLAKDDVRIETVEHLLAALAALRIDNVLVELDAAEVPIMDGSAAPFIYLIHEAGVRSLSRARSCLRIKRPLTVGVDGREVAVYPADSLRITYTIQFNHPLLRYQYYSLAMDEASFIEEIAPARTFGFLKDVELMRQNGLALGGSLDNAVVLGETGVLNNPLRFPDEFVRHKILDILGDLSLLGRPLLAHVVAARAGHALHTEMVRRIIDSPDDWELVTHPEPAAAAVAAGEPVLTEPVS